MTCPTDPMPGSIARATERVKQGYMLDERELALALNESFRNGMRHETAAAHLPIEIEVYIPGLPCPGENGTTRNFRATRAQGATAERPLYTITDEHNPNDVAVGRFKKSLRKFLGLD